jgi:hypothetical protein
MKTPKSLLVLIDVLIYVAHTSFTEGLKLPSQTKILEGQTNPFIMRFSGKHSDGPSIDQKIARFRDHLMENGSGTHIGPTMHRTF